MNIFEIELERMEKRVKKLDESMGKNPDPRKLKSNKLLYELDIALRKAQIEAFEKGKPFGSPPGIPGMLGLAMGFIPTQGITVPNVPQGDAMGYFDEVRSMGLVGDSCDMSIIVYALRRHFEGLKEEISVIYPIPCTVQYLASLQCSYHENQINYFMDVGFEENEENLIHVADQLGEFIEFAEKKIKGIKYDEDKLREIHYHRDKARGYYKEIYEMLKHKPCPLGGKDAFWQVMPFVPGLYPDPVKAGEYAKARRDEVAERVEKGIAAVPDEKARVLWTVTRPFFMDNFKALEKWGIVVPLFYNGATNLCVPVPENRYWGDRELTPLENEAAEIISALWSGTGSKWVDTMIWICKDLDIDGIVNYNQRGASCTLGLKAMVEEAAERELGIPTLQLEGAQWDTSCADEKEITMRLDEFSQFCLSRKGIE